MTSHDPFVPHRIGDLAEVFDGPHATPRKVDQGPWYLNIASLKNGRLDLSESAHIHADDVAKWTARVKPKRGDTLFSYETRLGESAFWDRNDEAVLGRRMGLLRPREDKVDPRFLAYAYLSDQFQEAIRIGTLHGATVNRIPVGDLPNWEIMVPSLPEQRRIAGVLGAFDDLIETNRTIINEIAAMTSAVYTKAATCASSSVALGQLVEANPEKVTPGAPTEDLRYLDIGSMSDGSVGTPTQMIWENAPSRARRRARRGDLLWATVRPNRRAHGLLMRNVPGLAVSTGIAVLRPLSIPASLAFAHTDTQSFVDRLSGRVDGSAYPAVKAEDFLALDVPDLLEKDVELFRLVIDPLWEAVGELEEEIDDVARHRDELLPLLMSGRVRVSEVEGVA